MIRGDDRATESRWWGRVLHFSFWIKAYALFIVYFAPSLGSRLYRLRVKAKSLEIAVIFVGGSILVLTLGNVRN